MFFFFPHVVGPAIGRLENAVDEFREVDGAMTVNAMATFLHVSRRLHELGSNDTSLRDLSSQMNIPHSSFIRLVAALSEGGPGLKSWRLLERATDPDEDQRQRAIGLTLAGRRLLTKVEQHLESKD